VENELAVADEERVELKREKLRTLWRNLIGLSITFSRRRLSRPGRFLITASPTISSFRSGQ
jgi:hypothetical protein